MTEACGANTYATADGTYEPDQYEPAATHPQSANRPARGRHVVRGGRTESDPAGFDTQGLRQVGRRCARYRWCTQSWCLLRQRQKRGCSHYCAGPPRGSSPRCPPAGKHMTKAQTQHGHASMAGASVRIPWVGACVRVSAAVPRGSRFCLELGMGRGRAHSRGTRRMRGEGGWPLTDGKNLSTTSSFMARLRS